MSRLLAWFRSSLPGSGALTAALVLSGVVTGPGCASTDGMVDKLYDSTRAYNRSLRWGDWDRAAEYLPSASADAFMDSHQAVEDRLVVLDYQMTRLEVDKVNGVAASQVEISWHTADHLVVRTTNVNHLWQWYEGRWVLVDERRSGGKPLSIFAEVAEDQPHPYLPGLEAFRDEYAIGMDVDEKRKRERAQRKAERARKADPDQKYSLDDLDSMPIDQRPASFN
ncbi:hypothetical protein ENSA5_19500 [Enhygromyxa salina]|uniref:Lipoprotein n=1 Tax=Enhygromyxa salina TaxID=215803 RepID=A0A2S9YDB8_9BACT|nr:hypothetical protein [Enhygromyxa salina]PRQ03011.1 hypothetical protein ENSA5_19500 [Enhygromyxa salina]